MLRIVRQVLHDMFTGPDGQHYAIGRAYSVPVFIGGLGYPAYLATQHDAPHLSEVGPYLLAFTGALTILIFGTRNVDEGAVTRLMDALPRPSAGTPAS